MLTLLEKNVEVSPSLNCRSTSLQTVNNYVMSTRQATVQCHKYSSRRATGLFQTNLYSMFSSLFCRIQFLKVFPTSKVLTSSHTWLISGARLSEGDTQAWQCYLLRLSRMWTTMLHHSHQAVLQCSPVAARTHLCIPVPRLCWGTTSYTGC